VTLPAGARRVREAFARAALENRRALIPYLVAGYPDPGTAIDASAAALEAGSDLLEIGVPFSDPVADGPVIAAAGHAAVAAGAGVDAAVGAVRALRERGHGQPILAMGYLNPIVARGRERTLRELREAGVDALIVPDLPAGEDRGLERLVADAGLGICFLVTPNSSSARLEAAVRGSTAFLYVVPLYGVTGARERVAETTVPLLERIRNTVDGRLPVAVGFGVSSPEHVRELTPIVDGIIVGSAIVAALNDGGASRVRTFVAGLAAATARAAVLELLETTAVTPPQTSASSPRR
jgi:tryptophan synthase alpha chain